MPESLHCTIHLKLQFYYWLCSQSVFQQISFISIRPSFLLFYLKLSILLGSTLKFHIFLFIPEAPMPNLLYLRNHPFCCKPYFHLKSPVQYNFSVKYQDNRTTLPFSVLRLRHHPRGLHNYIPGNYVLQTAG